MLQQVLKDKDKEVEQAVKDKDREVERVRRDKDKAVERARKDKDKAVKRVRKDKDREVELEKAQKVTLQNEVARLKKQIKSLQDKERDLSLTRHTAVLIRKIGPTLVEGFRREAIRLLHGVGIE
jgi:hypothetical protein